MRRSTKRFARLGVYKWCMMWTTTCLIKSLIACPSIMTNFVHYRSRSSRSFAAMKMLLNAGQRSSRSGVTLPTIVGVLLAVGALVGFLTIKYMSSGDKAELFNPITTVVERGDFVSQVLDQGQIQSSENVEIRCEARSRNGSTTVLNVVPEASLVRPGDFLIQLDSTAFEKELEEQRITLVNSQAAVIQAESTLASAQAALREYMEGTFLQEKMTIENEINAATGNMLTAKQLRQQAEETYEYNRKLQARGFITSQALQAADFERNKTQVDVNNAINQKKLAQTRLNVLVDITKEKNVVQLEADIKAARVRLDSERQALEVESEKLVEIQTMVSKCRIVVPEGVSGQVSYARKSSRSGNDWELEEGATVRENQVLIRVPNPEKMEVKTLINEQSITQIEAGMVCDIKVDALNSRPLKGVVTRVNQFAESSRWLSSSVRKYAVFVKIMDPPAALKPGMNAAVTVQVREVPDVLIAPIQTVYAVQGRKFCLVQNGDQWVTREIEIDGDNSQRVLIKSGLQEGDVLVMNPGGFKDQLNLPEIPLDSRIELPEGKVEAGDATVKIAKGSPKSNKAPELPANGRELITAKDTNRDGKLSQDEIGLPFSNFFSRIDTDADGFVTEVEANKQIKRMKNRGGTGRGGAGRKGLSKRVGTGRSSGVSQ